MKNNWTKVLLSTAAIATIFTACKPKPDTDTPFPPKVSPSVFMASQNQFVYALNPLTGDKKWECFVGSNVASSPYLYAGTLFVGNSSPILFKIDPNTGSRNQSKLAFPAGIFTNPIGKENFLIITTGTDIKCIDIVPDTLEWSYTALGTINSSPTIRDTQVVFGCDDGSVYMLDHRDGKLIWKTASIGAQYRSSPTMDDKYIYIGANDFKMYSLNRKDGSIKWSYTTGAPVQSSPIIFGGNVIFGSDDSKLYCLENTNGTPRWTTTAADRIRSSPYLYGQTIYVGSYDEGFYAVNALNGSIKWRFTTKGLVASSPVCYLDNVYIGSYDKYLYSIDTASGKSIWKYAINGLIDCSPSIDANNSNGTGINSTVSGSSIY
jgi:eukaryotic-like serine/threonine-protein kinase